MKGAFHCIKYRKLDHMTKIFISAPFFSKRQVNIVKKLERALKLNPSVTEIASPRLDQSGCGYTKEKDNFGWSSAVYRRDLNIADWCDASIEVLDFDHQDCDSGTMFEMGYLKASHKPTYTLHIDKDPVNLMEGVGSTYDFHSFDDVLKHDFSKPSCRNYTGKMC